MGRRLYAEGAGGDQAGPKRLLASRDWAIAVVLHTRRHQHFDTCSASTSPEQLVGIAGALVEERARGDPRQSRAR